MPDLRNHGNRCHTPFQYHQEYHQPHGHHGRAAFAWRWPIFGIAAIVAFAIALILHVAGVSHGDWLNAVTFALIGLLCVAVHLVRPWWPNRG